VREGVKIKRGVLKNPPRWGCGKKITSGKLYP